MSRRISGSFMELQGLSALPVSPDDGLSVSDFVAHVESCVDDSSCTDPDCLCLTRMSEVHTALCNRLLRCAGAFRDIAGQPGSGQNDEFWGADIAELVLRSLPHDIWDGSETVSVAVKLDTLQAEFDKLGEICAWIYEES